ncbi:MAG: ATP-binding protein [Prolixibacteraceae bacterium]
MPYIKRYQHWLISLLFLMVLLWGSVRFSNFKKDQWEKDVRNQTLETLIAKKSSLEKALYSRIYYTRGVAAFVSLKPLITNEEFGHLAKEFIQNDSVISTMSLSRNCVINAIYPLEGHEAALGLDLLEHPERKEIVDQTIQSHKTFVAGPVELVEGGMAFISYTPIFDSRKDQSGSFWGLTDIVIKRDALFREAHIQATEKNLMFALRGYDGKGANGAVFWGDAAVFERQPVSITIELPYGNWVLAAVPQVGWTFYYDQDVVLSTILMISSIIISILLLILLKTTARIKSNAREFKAIFNSLDTLIIEFDSEGKYVKVAPTNLDLLVCPPEEILGKTLADIFEPEMAKLFLNAIRECLKTKKVVIIDYPMVIKGEPKWFVARISYKSEKTVIYNAYDVTNIKKAENELKESEEHLAKLNAIKDRFFSIIAHDLRNPVASFQSITELILEPSIPQTPQELKVLIKSLNTTSIGLGELLENLFSWALAQQSSIEIKPISQCLHEVCDRAIVSHQSHALLKKIQLQNMIDIDHYATFDLNATNIIFRNLISNAIKFSNPDSVITISSELTKVNNKEFLLIHVSDKGIGISAEKMAQLFNVEVNTTSNGTNKEKGSGLGLILCQEYAKMQGGQLQVKSELGKGSVFTFSLPV